MAEPESRGERKTYAGSGATEKRSDISDPSDFLTTPARPPDTASASAVEARHGSRCCRCGWGRTRRGQIPTTTRNFPAPQRRCRPVGFHPAAGRGRSVRRPDRQKYWPPLCPIRQGQPATARRGLPLAPTGPASSASSFSADGACCEPTAPTKPLAAMMLAPGGEGQGGPGGSASLARSPACQDPVGAGPPPAHPPICPVLRRSRPVRLGAREGAARGKQQRTRRLAGGGGTPPSGFGGRASGIESAIMEKRSASQGRASNGSKLRGQGVTLCTAAGWRRPGSTG